MTTKQTLFADEESVTCLKAPKQVSAPWVEITPQIISFKVLLKFYKPV